MHLDANDLILFARVMEAGSFSRAAFRVGMPKSTLSRRITQLESRLGERLLIRSTRKLAMTEFGERIFEHGQRLVEETEAATAMVQHRQETPRGLLRVSIPPDFAEMDLTPLLLRFASAYPEVRLELDISPRRVDIIAERFDLAIRAASQLPDDTMLVARRLCDMTLHLYASPAYLNRYGEPQRPDDLPAHICLPLIGANGESQAWRLASAASQWQGIPNGPLASNSLGLQSELAMHGMGIVGMVDHFAEKWVTQGYLKRVLPDWSLPTVTLWCVTPGRRLLPTRTTAFVEMLMEEFLAKR